MSGYTCPNDCCEVTMDIGVSAGKRPSWIIHYNGVRGSYSTHAQTLGMTPEAVRHRIRDRACLLTRVRTPRPSQGTIEDRTAEITKIANQFLRLPRVTL